MLLLIDQGNTALKWCIYKNRQPLPSKSGQLVDLKEFVNSENLLIKGIFISSVKNEKQIQLLCTALEDVGISAAVTIAQSQEQYLQLINGYDIPTNLGVDRWLVMVALWRRFKSGFIVVDAGSALTLDIVENSGLHLGGHIIPGLSMQKKSLLTDTQGVNFGNDVDALVNIPGKSTSSAVNNGCITNLCNYINSMYQQHSCKNNLPLIITGGDAQILSKSLVLKHQLITDLVLEGLYYSFHSK